MKRHNFNGQGASHGNHKHHRAPGSVGACATPARVFKGTRMAGQHRCGPGHHPQPRGGQGRRRAQPAAHQGRGARPPGRHGAHPRRRQGRQVMALSARGARRRRRASTGSVTLDEAIFGIQPNVPVLHQVVTAQLAAARAGTQSTKTRAEVSGGGRKPFKQKGTGRARQGSERAPHFTGGGVALGPKPRSYRQRTPRKMIQLALRSALSDRAADGKVVVVELVAVGDSRAPRTPGRPRRPRSRRQGAGGAGADQTRTAYKSFRNLPGVQLLLAASSTPTTSFATTGSSSPARRCRAPDDEWTGVDPDWPEAPERTGRRTRTRPRTRWLSDDRVDAAAEDRDSRRDRTTPLRTKEQGGWR